MSKLVTVIYDNDEEREFECDFLVDSIYPNCMAMQDGDTIIYVNMNRVYEVWEEEAEETG